LLAVDGLLEANMNPEQALSALLRLVGRSWDDADQVSISGEEPLFPSRFKLATAASAAITATGVAASDLWEIRTGRKQAVSVTLRDSAAAIRSDRYLRINGEVPPTGWSEISGFYRTRDGRWIQLHCNFPQHRDGVLGILDCPAEMAEVARAVSGCNGYALEGQLAEAGLCAGVVRSRAEWIAHPQGRAVSALPVIEVTKVTDGRPEELPEAERPLAGIRVLDLTRVIAGPVAGRTLVEHGADVLRVTAAHLPGFPHGLDIDMGHGKLSAEVDLRSTDGHAALESLVNQTDVFLQSYRPGALAGRGFSLQTLMRQRPGIIYATLSAYGHVGPWQGRRGFDTLVQSVSGIAEEEGGESPRHLPAQALDYVSGYLLAFGIMSAVARRAREGGSYLVRVSLAQTAAWLDRLGRVESIPSDKQALDKALEDADDLLVVAETAFGTLQYLGPVVRMSETPPRWERPSVPLGTSPAAWPELQTQNIARVVHEGAFGPPRARPDPYLS
jgi:crotonobetainyl-CoA:carnitine CoA-transferase CaiB-like acyl-CoA transferase